MEINFVAEKYEDPMKHILSYCFGLPPEFGDGFMTETFKSKNCLGCFDGEQLAGLLYITPFEMFFNNRIVLMGGIGGVSTLPEYRHCHCASNMLIKSLEIMKERGYIFSALGPFSYDFYRKYGWELGFHSKRYEIPIEKLKGLGKGIGRFKPLTPDKISSVKTLYEYFMSKYNGAIRRDDKTWKSKLNVKGKDRDYAYGYSSQTNELNGYILYSILGNKIHVNELIYDSLDTKLELMRFVYNHSAQVETLVWNAPEDDITMLMLKDPRIGQTINPGMMIRVVDVKKTLEAYEFPLLYRGSLAIKIHDEFASWNNGTFNVVIRDGSAIVDKTENNSPDIECDIQTFSQIMLGYIGMEEAIDIGKVTSDIPVFLDDLKILFKRHVTHMTDGF